MTLEEAAEAYRAACADRSDWKRRAMLAADAAEARVQALEAALTAIRQAAGALIAKLDQIIPKVDSLIAFQTVRAGRPAYDGPDLIKELATLRQLLLPPPDADPGEETVSEHRPRRTEDGEIAHGCEDVRRTRYLHLWSRFSRRQGALRDLSRVRR